MYVQKIIGIEQMLKEEFKRTGQAVIAKDSKKLRELFRPNENYTLSKFSEMLSATRGKPNVEEQVDIFVWKKAYDISDKESLRKFMLEFGEFGIKDDDDEKLRMCYKGVIEDLEELIEEGWVRKLEFEDKPKGNNTKTTCVYFPKDLRNNEVEF